MTEASNTMGEIFASQTRPPAVLEAAARGALTAEEITELQKGVEALRQIAANHLGDPSVLAGTNQALAAMLAVLGAGNEHHQRAADAHIRLHTDTLTGIPNEAALKIALDKAIRLNGAPSEDGTKKSYYALMAIDLDRFKGINDHPDFGHPGGDKALQVFGQTLAQRVRELPELGHSKMGFRKSGDEFFAILRVDADNPEEAAARLANLHDQIQNRFVGLHFEFNGHTAPLVMSSGIHAIEAGDTAEMAYQNADAALIRVKQNTAAKAARYQATVNHMQAASIQNIATIEDKRAAEPPTPTGLG